MGLTSSACRNYFFSSNAFAGYFLGGHVPSDIFFFWGGGGGGGGAGGEGYSAVHAILRWGYTWIGVKFEVERGIRGLETLPDSWPPQMRAPGWQATVWYPSTNSSLQISIFQIHKIFNHSYFPQFNLSFEKNYIFPLFLFKFTANRQTVFVVISIEI